VNLHGRGPQSHRLLRALRPRRLVAFASDGVAGPQWRADEHERARWCRMLAGHGIAADPDDLELRAPPARVRGSPYLLAHPGAASAARRWPARRWVALLASEAAAGRAIVLTGGPAEGPLVEAIARRLGGAPVERRAGTLGLVELAGLVAGAEAVVCSDTGVGHLATALRTPSVLLFGPSSPAHWGPPPDRPWHRVLWAGTTGDPRAERLDPGLARLTVRDVQEALAELRTGDARAAACARSA
jgi:ADP-heptose:LPS heptosyltransferase